MFFTVTVQAGGQDKIPEVRQKIHRLLFGLLKSSHVGIYCTFVEYVPNKRLKVQIKGALNGMQSFDVKPTDTDCHLSSAAEYEIPIPLVGKIAESLLKKQN